MVVHRAGVLLKERAEGVLIPGAHARAQAQFHALSCAVPVGEFPTQAALASATNNDSVSATQAAFFWPSISIRIRTCASEPSGVSFTSVSVASARIDEPVSTGEGKRTRSRP